MAIPNCFNAMDGKYVALFHPIHSGSTYYNYKEFKGIVLLALVDVDYKFVYVYMSTLVAKVKNNFRITSNKIRK